MAERARLSWWQRLNPRMVAGGAVILALVATAMLAPLLAPHDPLDQDLMNALLPPRWLAGGDAAFPLGTDDLGRDVLSRLIFGTRVTVTVAVVAAGLACALGSLLGLVAGFFRGAADLAVSRLVDVWMAFPPVLLSIVLAAMLGAGLAAVIVAIAVIDWTRFARIVRAETMLQTELDYVAAARTLGLRRGAILMREVLPNVLPLILTLLSVEMGIAVVVEAILSFVGVSVTSDFPTWGGMVAEGRQVIHQAWWVLVFPTLCLIVVVLGFNLLGDGLRPGDRSDTAMILEIENLWVSTGSALPLLRGVSLGVGGGEVHGLVGESGAGKSMIGRAVLGLLPPRASVRAGRIRYLGTNLLAQSSADRRLLLGREISVIPQDPMMSLNPVRRIRTQMVDLLRRRIGLDRTVAHTRALALLDEVMISDPARVAALYPHELSGGMRQRVLIALAFAGTPRLIIADEPTTALDVTVQRGILRLLRDMQARHGAAVLFVTHDLGIVAKICRTMTVLHAGRVLEQGVTETVLGAPRHPYTRALLAATPRVDRPGEVLQPIPRAVLDRLWSEAGAASLPLAR